METLESGVLRRAVKRSVSEPDEGGDDCEVDGGGGDAESAPDDQTILRMREPNEKVVCNCVKLVSQWTW